ncbi:hypothetical protein BJX61DRAFT_520514 [Aspergillus egyptiacus]|nr:hypothetical protein BJX61DRAFT_520514 [Aspergillus egyptiacus]
MMLSAATYAELSTLCQDSGLRLLCISILALLPRGLQGCVRYSSRPPESYPGSPTHPFPAARLNLPIDLAVITSLQQRRGEVGSIWAATIGVWVPRFCL